MKVRGCLLSCKVREIGKAEDRTLRFVGTDETPDRMNSIIKADGWEFRNFSKNPIFLWSHKSEDPPIGKVVRISKGTQDSDKQLFFDVKFAPKSTYAFADTIYQLYKGGFLNGVSVGFETLKKRVIENKKELDALGLKPPAGEVLEKNELWELSGVSVPANPNALQEKLAEVGSARGVTIAPYSEAISKEAWALAQLEKVRESLKEPEMNQKQIERAVIHAVHEYETKGKDARFTCPFPFTTFEDCVSKIAAGGGAADPEAVCGAWHAQCTAAPDDNPKRQEEDEEEEKEDEEKAEEKPDEKAEHPEEEEEDKDEDEDEEEKGKKKARNVHEAIEWVERVIEGLETLREALGEMIKDDDEKQEPEDEDEEEEPEEDEMSAASKGKGAGGRKRDGNVKRGSANAKRQLEKQSGKLTSIRDMLKRRR